jgi:hypothetical protein
LPVLGDSVEGLVLLPGHVEGDMISWDAGDLPGGFLANDDAEGGTMFRDIFLGWHVLSRRGGLWVLISNSGYNIKVLDVHDEWI